MDLSIADPKQFLEVKEFIWKSKLLFGNPKQEFTSLHE